MFSPSPIICLMGPTAVGKTPLAIELAQSAPVEIISVDSAMVYQGLDIGTGKPDANILAAIPHHLVNIVTPAEIYSAGQFQRDALTAIQAIQAKGKIPLLVGGTMLYFRVLQQGIATLPMAHSGIRQALQQRAEEAGWEALHQQLAMVDPKAAAQIHPRDSQRIQRALEVYELTGRPMTEWQANAAEEVKLQFVNIALMPNERATLHERIKKRFAAMLAAGFVEEVRNLVIDQQLSPDLPALRAVGYRQISRYLAGQIDDATMQDQALAATRQLAKRQITWLRSWPQIQWVEADSHALSRVKELSL